MLVYISKSSIVRFRFTSVVYTLYLSSKIIEKALKIIGKIEYKIIIAIKEFSFIWLVSKEVNSKVIKEIATAKAKENFVIIAQKPNKTPEILLFIFSLICATSD